MHTHPCTVIWDLESSACHLQIKHKGSISCKYLYFATFILLAINFPFPQSVLTSAKKARLQELIGEVEEDELEGEAVVGPSGEATTHSSGSTPPIFILFEFCTEILFQTLVFFFFNLSFSSLLFSLLTDDSAEEEAPKLQTKQERDIDTLQSCMQVGSFQIDLKRRHGGC